MDTTNKTLRVHDGETAGGTALAKRADVPSMTAIIASIMRRVMLNWCGVPKSVSALWIHLITY